MKKEKLIIGFATDEIGHEVLQAVCDEIMLVDKATCNLAKVLAFVETHKEDEVHLANMQSLNLQLVQLLSVLDLLTRNDNYFRVHDKGILNYLSDQEYHHFFSQLAANEKDTIVKRTQKGLKEAIENGKRIGRPKISDELVDKIKFLHQSRKCTIREISEICNVSLGTVYKYAFPKEKS